MLEQSVYVGDRPDKVHRNDKNHMVEKTTNYTQQLRPLMWLHMSIAFIYELPGNHGENRSVAKNSFL